MAAAIATLVIGLGALIAGLGYVRKAKAMRGFASTAGTVIQREVVPAPGGDTTEGVWGEGGGYMPKVTYRFTAGGKERTGDRFSYAYQGLKKSVAEKRLAAIPEQVTVWFDPKNPDDAYLLRHTPTVGWFLIVPGAIAALGAVAWLSM